MSGFFSNIKFSIQTCSFIYLAPKKYFRCFYLLEELRHFTVGVPGDDCPVSIVLTDGLGKLQVEGVGTDLDSLDAAVLLNGDTILVPCQLGVT